MALTIKGSGIVNSTDFKTVVWRGLTKGGKAARITLSNAINMSNIDLSMVEKDDTVASLTFTAAYSNTNAMVSTLGDYEEPWEIAYSGATTDPAADGILLGAGVISINGTDVALTRGGSSFSVEREYREINADGDRGVVSGRVVIDRSSATLTCNLLTWLVHMDDYYPAIVAST